MSGFKGWFGEKATAAGMWMRLDKSVYRRFHDVYVPAPDGTTQIDHLVVSPFGLFVIETKNIDGWIFGSEKDSQWTQNLYGKKYRFQNPLRQNYRHTKCLAEYLDLDLELLHSVVFFIGECTFKTPMPLNVVNSGLSSYIKSFSSPVLADSEIQAIGEAITRLKADRSLNHRNHMQSLRERHSSTTVCPKCGAELVERTARRGAHAGSTFLGCSEYPRCRYVKSVTS